MAPIDRDRAMVAIKLTMEADDVFDQAVMHRQAGQIAEAGDLLLKLYDRIESVRGFEPDDNPFLSSMEPIWVQCQLMLAMVLVEIAKRCPNQRAPSISQAHALWSEACKTKLWDDHSVDDMVNNSVPEICEGAIAHKDLIDALCTARDQLARFFSQFPK